MNTDPGHHRKSSNPMKHKIVIAIVLLIIVVIFTLLNTEPVDITFFFWRFEISKALLMFILLGIGTLIGFFLGSYSTKHTKKEPDTGFKSTRSI
ncbi:MAG: LapA family protein [Desulfovibrionales bacterium]